MDIITKKMLDTFSKNQSIQNFDEAHQFEYFVNYIILSSYNDNVDLDSFETDNTSGIDGAAVIINNRLVTSVLEAEDIIQSSSNISVKFVFISTKTSSKFEGQYISNLFSGVQSIFEENGTSKDINGNSYIEEIYAIKEKIFDNAAKLSENPILELFLCTTGVWDDENHRTLVNRSTKSLKDFGLFSDVHFTPYGKNEIQELYRKSSRALNATIQLEGQIPLPDLKGVESAYITIIKASEFLKILSHSSDKINKSIFYDNVRDFQEDSSEANKSMKSTLTDNSKKDKFCLYNNGITILVKDGGMTGKNITLKDYQIVNGCQTSNVLFNIAQKGEDISEILIPVKIIINPDESVREDIIRSTNTQKAISSEQFLSLTKFSRQLEDYFKSFIGYELYYERRNGQYRGTDINSLQIIDQKTLIKIVGTVLLDLPEEAIRYPVSFYKKHKDDLFQDNSSLEAYYLSSYLYYSILKYLREEKYSRPYKNLIFYILFIAKKLIYNNSIDKFCNKKNSDILKKFNDVFQNKEHLEEIISKSITILEKSCNIEKVSRDTYSTKKFKEKIAAKFETYKKSETNSKKLPK